MALVALINVMCKVDVKWNKDMHRTDLLMFVNIRDHECIDSHSCRKVLPTCPLKKNYLKAFAH